MNRIKVVLAEEMARIEKIAINDGASSDTFMLQAGKALAEKIENLFLLENPSRKKKKTSSEQSSFKKILILAGKGNNGGDGFTLGTFLLKKGYSVRAMLFFDPSEFSDLCLKNFNNFKKAGGSYKKIESASDLIFDSDELLVDAIFGTGFNGKLDKTISSFIKNINLSKNIKISIDIPSGLSGDSGLAENGAVVADHTIYLALPKSGFFINEGWKHVGVLHRADFGLREKYIEIARPMFYLLEGDVENDLPPIIRTRHKYEAGYVLAISGSKGMEGAANLSGRASLRSGAGIVKLFISDYSSKDAPEIADELVKIPLDLLKKEEILSECNKASAVYIGPGIGRSKEIDGFLKFLIPKISKPLVLDADALYFLSNNPDCRLPQNSILTPHKLEMLRLLNKKEMNHLDLINETQKFSDGQKVIIVLKGAPTFIFKTLEKPTIVIEGDPGMATAGSGDVLTGVITALLAQKMEPVKAAELGVFLHGRAGKAAAIDKGSYSMIASDIIEHLPEAFKKL